MQYLIYPVLLVAGWFMKSMWNAIGDLKRDLAALQLAISENYVKKFDLEAKFDLIMFELRELRDIIRGKADK
jgi:hypothetical protein